MPPGEFTPNQTLWVYAARWVHTKPNQTSWVYATRWTHTKPNLVWVYMPPGAYTPNQTSWVYCMLPLKIKPRSFRFPWDHSSLKRREFLNIVLHLRGKSQGLQQIVYRGVGGGGGGPISLTKAVNMSAPGSFCFLFTIVKGPLLRVRNFYANKITFDRKRLK